MTNITTLKQLLADLQARRETLPGDTPVRMPGMMKQTFPVSVSTGRIAKAHGRQAVGRLLVSRGGESAVFIHRIAPAGVSATAEVRTLDQFIADLQARCESLPSDTPVCGVWMAKQSLPVSVSTGRIGKAGGRSLAGQLLVSRGGEPVVLIHRD